MDQLLIGLICSVGVLIFAPLVSGLLNKFEKQKTTNFQSKVGWWLIASPNELLDMIQNRYLRGLLDGKYSIRSNTELESAYDIIQCFQHDSKYLYENAEDFVNGNAARKSSSSLFMGRLLGYLEDRESRYMFNGNRMYEVISKKDNVEKCAVTEYGLAFNKLLYMTMIHYEKENNCDNYFSNRVKDIIDTRYASFTYYNN